MKECDSDLYVTNCTVWYIVIQWSISNKVYSMVVWYSDIYVTKCTVC
jgi:hypothetical protein